MEESLEDARNELKRVDHLVYVSLKYTRTVDVLRNVINRIINTYDAVFMALLKYAKEKKKMKDIPMSPGLRCEMLYKLYEKEPKICENIEFYLSLRKLMKAKFKRKREFRRHVTMIADMEGTESELNIDIVKEHYEKTIDFVNSVRDLIKGKND